MCRRRGAPDGDARPDAPGRLYAAATPRGAPFQRPYVWEKEEQWAPLWQDVRRLAELRLSQPSADAKHFLGAIVVQAQEPILGRVPASSIIDGQQRLTTLQLLMDATAAALEAVGQ